MAGKKKPARTPVEAVSPAGFRPCAHPGCRKAGEYRAPKDPSLREYIWFCLEHVTEYNRNWNYFKDSSPEDIERQIRLNAVWDRPTWKFGQGRPPFRLHGIDPLNLFEGLNSFRQDDDAPVAVPEEDTVPWALYILELQFPLTLEALKNRYKLLAKLYHPDLTGGDKEREELFKKITKAYKILQGHLK